MFVDTSKPADARVVGMLSAHVLSSPESPAFAGCFAHHGYVHDTRCVLYDCVLYDGPDADYRGRFRYGDELDEVDHDIHTERRLAYAPNYTSGLRTYRTGKVGTWGNYPYFKRDVVSVSTVDRGLFVLRPRD